MNSKVHKKPFIIDSDMGPDDWVAILYLLLKRNIEIKAITIAGTGESHGKKGAINVRRLMKLTNQDTIPVSYGRSEPIACKHQFPWLMRLVIDSMMFIKIPKMKKKPQDLSAVELLNKVLNESTEKIRLLAIGPLTNIADLLTQFPNIKNKIEKIYIMGGAVDVPGNIKEIAFWKDNEYAEWNTYCDPRAANIVFRSGIPIVLVPLDATEAIPVDNSFIEKLKQEKQNSIYKVCLRVLNSLKSRVDKGKYYLWDVIAAVVSISEDFASFENRKIWVIEDEGKESGRMIDNSEIGNEIKVCKKVDKLKFEEEFLSTFQNS
ncbi:MAG: nucleoside hydrolase [archaeon]|nr:nucleoside hydrolase [archaeon]